MISLSKILKLYFIATFLSGFGIFLFYALPSLIFIRANQAHALVFMGSFFISFVFAVLNLVFFIPLNNKIISYFSTESILFIFFSPSIVLISYLYFTDSPRPWSDSFFFIISSIINIICIIVGSYLIFYRTNELDSNE